MIYVDQIIDYTGITKLTFKKWCHMWTDGTAEELHVFAEDIGLLRRWFQDKANFPHYDITPSKRTLALSKGAKFMHYMEYYKMQRARDKRSHANE
jgi:hypothetical protein